VDSNNRIKFPMSRRRFYSPTDSIINDRLELPIDESHHLREVLRLKVEDRIFVFDGKGNEYLCSIEELGRKDRPTILKILETTDSASPESPLDLILAIALLKGEKFDLVIQKATELGIKRIIPVVTQRTDIKIQSYDAPHKLTRWNRIAMEAAKQSGRALVPTIDSPTDFNSLITNASLPFPNLRLLFTERNGKPLSKIEGSSSNSIIALIGSEGGWEDEEIKQAEDAGWHTIQLGGRILRAETAAIVIIGLLQHLFGDLR
jgi:16S rRNA (uracil1498-N3)-methyltransferase